MRSASRDSGFGIRDSDGVVNLANPKSQIPNPDSASLFSHRHKRLVVAAPDAQLREVARLHLLELALCGIMLVKICMCDGGICWRQHSMRIKCMDCLLPGMCLTLPALIQLANIVNGKDEA